MKDTKNQWPAFMKSPCLRRYLGGISPNTEMKIRKGSLGFPQRVSLTDDGRSQTGWLKCEVDQWLESRSKNNTEYEKPVLSENELVSALEGLAFAATKKEHMVAKKKAIELIKTHSGDNQ